MKFIEILVRGTCKHCYDTPAENYGCEHCDYDSDVEKWICLSELIDFIKEEEGE